MEATSLDTQESETSVEDFYRRHPTRPVDWRSHSSSQSLGPRGQPAAESIVDDPEATAREIAEVGDIRRVQLEARVLARQSPEEIAKFIDSTPDVVRSYERLFFDVRNRLSARDYIFMAAIRKSGCRVGSDSRAEAFVRSLGYFLGHVVLDVFGPWLPLILTWDDHDRLKDSIDVGTQEGVTLLRLRLLFRLLAVDGYGVLSRMANSPAPAEQSVKEIVQDMVTLAEAEATSVEDGQCDVFDYCEQTEPEIVLGE